MEITQTIIENINKNSLYQTLGIQVEKVGDGKTTTRLVPEPNVCWPFPGQPHGGILFTLMDTTMAWAVLSDVPAGNNCSTVNLDIQYPNMATGEFFVCQAWIVHQTKRSCFMRADIHDSAGVLVAMGHATFRVFKSEKLASLLP